LFVKHSIQGVIQCVRCKKSFVTHQESAKYFAAPPHPAFEDSAEAESDSKKKMDAATAKMGEMMLQGWAMLAENCPNPDCPGIPLMRKRGSKESVCLLCDPTGEKATQKEVSQPPTPPPQPKVIPQNIPKPNVDTNLQKKRDMVSSKIGGKLLSGWTMLSQNCPNENCRGTPLMCKGNNGVNLCVCCDKEFGPDDSTKKAQVPTPPTVAVTPVPPASKPHTSSSSLSSASSTSDPYVSSYSSILPASGESKLEKASSCISNKLLLGWSMMSASCDECYTPLMKHAKGSNGEVVCVNSACEKYFDKKSTPTTTTASMATTTSPLLGQKKLLVEDDEDYEDDEEYDEVLDYKAKRFASASTQHEMVKPTVTNKAPMSGDKRGRLSIDSARKQALEAVAHKLSKAR
jgi:uncharacterized Zn finger protein (UPF0148 family)